MQFVWKKKLLFVLNLNTIAQIFSKLKLLFDFVCNHSWLIYKTGWKNRFSNEKFDKLSYKLWDNLAKFKYNLMKPISKTNLFWFLQNYFIQTLHLIDSKRLNFFIKAKYQKWTRLLHILILLLLFLYIYISMEFAISTKSLTKVKSYM